MNYKQKFGYTLLGAGIMIVGITIGQFITPGIEAQSPLNEIRCAKLTIEDKNGNDAIVLGPGDEGENAIAIFTQLGKEGASLFASDKGSGMQISRPSGTAALYLFGAQGMSAITLKDETGANAVELSVVDGLQQGIAVNNFKGKTAASLESTILGNFVIVYDKAGKPKWKAP